MAKRIIILLLLIGAYTLCTAQNIYTRKDSAVYEKYMAEFTKYRDKPMSELFVLTGKYFLGKPYTASTLESDTEEKLIVNLNEFDCTTFVESNIALAKELKKGEIASFTGFMNTLKDLRYREGQIDGYTSRIHYTSDWVYENTNCFDNITIRLGGAIVSKPLNFMSSKSHLYSGLKDSKANQARIRTIEQVINSRKSYALLPVSKIKQAQKDIKTGDIIIFGTKTEGLDYSHIGIALWESGMLKLLHASSAGKRVVIDKKTLLQYCTTSRTCSGITVLRLTDNYSN